MVSFCPVTGMDGQQLRPNGPLLQIVYGNMSPSSRVLHTGIGLSLPQIFISILVYIILPTLDKIHPRIRILIWRVFNERHKMLEIKDVQCFDVAGQL